MCYVFTNQWEKRITSIFHTQLRDNYHRVRVRLGVRVGVREGVREGVSEGVSEVVRVGVRVVVRVGVRVCAYFLRKKESFSKKNQSSPSCRWQGTHQHRHIPHHLPRL